MRRILVLMTVGALMAVMLAMSVGPAFAAPTGTVSYYCIDKNGTLLLSASFVPRSYVHEFRGECHALGGKVTKGLPY
jgi:hypothetical protein